MLQIKMTYCEPPQIVWCKDEYGYPVRGRAPKSPTRPARAYEVETWWEDVTPDEAVCRRKGASTEIILRETSNGLRWVSGYRHWSVEVGSNGKAKHV